MSCNEPFGSKVDHAENLWTACGAGRNGNGAIQEYAPGSKTPTAVYAEPENCGSGCTLEAYLLDVAYRHERTCFRREPRGRNLQSELRDGRISSSGGMRAIRTRPPDIADPDLTNADYIDVDTKGNLYVEGFGKIGTRSRSIARRNRLIRHRRRRRSLT